MNKELNKKLAEWAEFKDVEIDDLGNLIYWKGSASETKNWGWGKVPRFTESLDGCFKWLVPKLSHIDIIAKPQNNNTIIYVYPDHTSKTYEQTYANFVNTENVALALCLAIEKLIDNQNPTG